MGFRKIHDTKKTRTAATMAVLLGLGLGLTGDGPAVAGIATGADATMRRGEEPVAPFPPRPWFNGRMPETLGRKLRDGFELAVERLQTQAACRVLFAELGGDGLQKLAGTFYYPASAARLQQPCRQRAAVAFTQVGGRMTYLCDAFGKLSRQEAAVVLIHEALHHAGLVERPPDSRGLSSSEINRLVRKHCGLPG